MILVSLIAMFTLVGCNTPVQSVGSSDELLKLVQPVSPFAAAWLEKYGDSPESIKHYNLSYIRQVVEDQAKEVEQLKSQIDGLENKVRKAITKWEHQKIRVVEPEIVCEVHPNCHVSAEVVE